MPNDWPRTMTRGRLKGQTFEDQAEYAAALAALGDAPESDTPPSLDGAEGPTLPQPRKARGGKVNREHVEALIFPINFGLAMLPQTRADALDEQEVAALSNAIVKVAATNKHVERAILNLTTGSAYVELTMVVAMISVKRLARHNVIPPMFGMAVEAVAAEPQPSQNGHVEHQDYASTYPQAGAPVA